MPQRRTAPPLPGGGTTTRRIQPTDTRMHIAAGVPLADDPDDAVASAPTPPRVGTTPPRRPLAPTVSFADPINQAPRATAGQDVSAALNLEGAASISEVEVAPLVDNGRRPRSRSPKGERRASGEEDYVPAASGSKSGLAGSLRAMKFANKLQTKVNRITLIDVAFQKTTLVGSHVEYVILTRYQRSDQEPTEVTVSRSFRKFEHANKHLRKTIPTIPLLTSSGDDEADALKTQDAEHHWPEHSLEIGARINAVSQFLATALQTLSVVENAQFLEFLGIKQHGKSASNTDQLDEQHGAGIMDAFKHLGRRTMSAPKVPLHVQRTLEAQEDAEVDNRELDLWEVHKERQRKEQYHTLFQLILHLIYWILLMTQLGKAPNRVGLLKHQDAIWDLMLDEEFPDVSFKKNFADVMTEQEMWQWVDGPLTNAFHPPELAAQGVSEPQPLLMSNSLIGTMQIRLVRVVPETCNEVFGKVYSSQRGACAPRWLGSDGGNQATQPYGGTSGTEYQYTTFENKVQGPKILRMGNLPWDSASEDYGRGGYVKIIPRNREGWKQNISSLRCLDVTGGAVEQCTPFVDQYTRAITFSFNLLNGNDMSVPSTFTTDTNGADQLLAAQISITIDSTGHFDKFYRIYSMRPMREYFYGVDRNFVMFVGVLSFSFLLDAVNVRNQGLDLYFRSGMGSFWHCLDLFIYFLIGYSFYMGYVAWEESKDVLKDVEENMNQNKFVDVMTLRDHMRVMNKTMAWVSFFALVRAPHLLRPRNRSHSILSFVHTAQSYNTCGRQ